MWQSTKCLVLLCAMFASSAGAQAPMNARLLRRIAEAVDGDRSGRTVYVVAMTDSLNAVVGVFGTLDSAAAVARRKPNYASFGPYLSQRPLRTLELQPPSFISVCFHDGALSNMFPPERGHGVGTLPSGQTVKQVLASTGGKAGICTDTMMVAAKIARVSLVMEYERGGSWSTPVPPGVDAIFMGSAAIDKFVMPYYTATLGVDGAAALRRQLLGTIEKP